MAACSSEGGVGHVAPLGNHRSISHRVAHICYSRFCSKLLLLIPNSFSVFLCVCWLQLRIRIETYIYRASSFFSDTLASASSQSSWSVSSPFLFLLSSPSPSLLSILARVSSTPFCAARFSLVSADLVAGRPCCCCCPRCSRGGRAAADARGAAGGGLCFSSSARCSLGCCSTPFYASLFLPPAHRDFSQVKMDSFMAFTKCVLFLFGFVCIYRDGFMLGYGAAVSLIKNGVFELHDCCPTIDVPLLQQ